MRINRIDLLEKLLNLIKKGKDKADENNRNLFGIDVQEKFDKLKEESDRLDHNVDNLKAIIKEKEIKETEYKSVIDTLRKKIKELDAFRVTTSNFIMNNSTKHEEVLFLIRASEQMKNLQDQEDIESFSCFDYGGFITNKRHYEILNDYEPPPSFMKTLTNEVIYLDKVENAAFSNNSLLKYKEELINPKYDHGKTKEGCLKSDILDSDKKFKLKIPDECGEIITELFKIDKTLSRNEFINSVLNKTSNKNQKNLKNVFNSSSNYQDLKFSWFGISKYDKLQSTFSKDAKIKCPLHIRQHQPINTSQKIVSSRNNAYRW